MVHGLGGSHRSVYVRRIANRLTGNGMRVYSIDLRGVGAGAIHAKSFYNATCSADIRSALEWMAEQNPGSPLVLAGFSMGGGIALKMSGEAADRPINGLVGVAALGAPLDLVRCAELISQYPFYDRFYVKHLISQVHARSRHFPELEIPPFPRGTTLRRFDEIYTVPQGGFASIEEYLRQASALQWVSRIRMPTFLLTSRDDPFIDVGSYDELPPSPFCETIVAPSGGHLGFLGHDGNGGFRWAEARVAQWILSQGFVPNQFRIAQ
ncbi:MAG: alpha/beta fold hydrolase [Planctomycetes bacterium]|nr:alpha/beta fold hydrolase [Planctomycetota bacterium]